MSNTRIFRSFALCSFLIIGLTLMHTSAAAQDDKSVVIQGIQPLMHPQ